MRPLVISMLSLIISILSSTPSSTTTTNSNPNSSSSSSGSGAQPEEEHSAKEEAIKNLSKYASSSRKLQELIGQLREEEEQNKSVAFDQQTAFSREELLEEGRRNGMRLVTEVAVPERSKMLLVLSNKTNIRASFSTDQTDKFYYWKFGQTAATIVIFVMIVFGNLSILHRLKSCRRRRSNVNYFIVQLAIADLFVGFFNVTLDFILRLQREFTYGPLACRATKYISLISFHLPDLPFSMKSKSRSEPLTSLPGSSRSRNQSSYGLAGSPSLSTGSGSLLAAGATLEVVAGSGRAGEMSEVAARGGLLVLFIYSSTYLLVALSIDRWEAVVKPLAFTRNRSRGYYLVSGAWLLAFLCATPVTLHTRIKEFQGRPQCWIELDELGWKIYMVWLTCSLLIIPALVIAICYTHIVYTIWTKGNSRQKRPPNRLRVLLRRFVPDRKSSRSTTLPASSGGTIAIEEAKGVPVQLPVAQANLQEEEEEASELESVSTDEDSPPEVIDLSATIASNDKPGNGYKQQGEIRFLKADETTTTRELNKQNCPPQMVELGKLPTAAASCKAALPVVRNRKCAPQQHGAGVIPQARIKTIKMTLVIVAAFLLCWAPFYIINLCSVFGLFKRETNFTVALRTLTQSLAHLNSAMNPIIFWLFSSKRLHNQANPQRSTTLRSLPTSDTNNITSNNQRSIKAYQPESERKWQLNKCLCCFRWLLPAGATSPNSQATSGKQTNSKFFDSTSGLAPQS